MVSYLVGIISATFNIIPYFWEIFYPSDWIPGKALLVITQEI